MLMPAVFSAPSRLLKTTIIQVETLMWMRILSWKAWQILLKQETRRKEREKQGDTHLPRDVPKEQRRSDEELLSIGLRRADASHYSSKDSLLGWLGRHLSLLIRSWLIFDNNLLKPS